MVWQPTRYHVGAQPDTLIARLSPLPYYAPPQDIIGTGRVPRHTLSLAIGAFNNIFATKIAGLPGKPTKQLVTQPLQNSNEG